MKQKRVYEDDNRVGSQQLEVRSSADEAWYNATMEVLADRVRVRFEGFDEEEDEIWDVDYLKKFVENISNVVRLTSPQLQDQDCARVVKDMVVCARHVRNTGRRNDNEVKYFDAVITRVNRKPHTFLLGEECCSCRFEAYWLTGPDKKRHKRKVRLNCGDICLPHSGNAEAHPDVGKIMRIIDRRIFGRPLQQPVKEVSKSGKSKSQISDTKKTGERCECSPVSSQKTEVLDSHGIGTDSKLIREAGSMENREVCAREMPQRAEDCDIAPKAVEDTRSTETDAGEDLSLSPSSIAAKKRSKLDDPMRKYMHLISRKVGKKKANNPPSKRDFSKVPLKRMRGSVTDQAKPPAWFKPPVDR